MRALFLAAALASCAPLVGGEDAPEALRTSAEALVAASSLAPSAFESPAPPATSCGAGCTRLDREANCGPGRVNDSLAMTLGIAGGMAAGAWTGGSEPPDPERARELTAFGGADIAATSAALAWLAYDRIRSFKHEPHTSSRSRWTDCGAAGGDGLNEVDAGVRRAARWENRAAAARASDALLVASLVAPIGHLARRDTWRDGRYLLEAAAISAALNTATKRFFHRPRPYTHYCDLPCGASLDDEDARLSFYSGHATLAFTAAAATGTLAAIRGEPHVGRTWATGMAMAAATSYLRVAGDRHYLTDVLTGAVIGSAVGWGVVRLHRGEPVPAAAGSTAAQVTPVPALSLPLGNAGRGWLHAGPTRGGFAASASWSW